MLKLRNNMRILRKISVLFACAFVSFALVFHTQAINEDFYVDFLPEIPGSNSSVFANLVSYSFDVNRANITWILNGQTKLRGTGQKNFSFVTGDLGTRTSISVLVTTDEGAQVKKDFSFQPAAVDILWEALNYTPLAYKGKSLPVSGSLIKITALPYFSEASSRLIYEWQIDYKNFPDISGTGKDSFVLDSADIYNTNKIKVTVSNYNKTITAQKSIDIEIGVPKVVFYEESPLEGPKYNKALVGEIQLEQDEIIVRAEPYFFSTKDLKKLSYEWFMNEQKIFSEEFPNIFFIRKGESSGSSIIGVKISNPLNILQYADVNLGINY